MKDPEDRFASVIERLLNRVAVCRDHPVHQALVAGTLTDAQLRRLAFEQWHFHIAFPQVLTRLGTLAGTGGLGAGFANQTDVRHEDRTRSAAELWLRVAASLGVEPEEILASKPGAATAAMMRIQHAVVAEPVAPAYLAIMIGVLAEARPWLSRRKEAFETAYGVSGDALEYFDVVTPELDWGAHLAAILPHVQRGDLDLTGSRLECVLVGRWNYFSYVGDGAYSGGEMDPP